MSELISRRGFAASLTAFVAGIAVQPGSAQRGRRDASSPEDSQTSPSSSVCVAMEERDGAFVLEGHGKMLSEPFVIAAGTYRIEVELSNPARTDSGFWIDFIAREDGEVDDYYAVSDSEGPPEVSSAMLELTYDGEYLAEQSSFR